MPPQDQRPDRGEDFGVDTKGVRRGSAPIQLPYKTGTLAAAQRLASCPTALAAARARIRAKMDAKSAAGPRQHKLKTVRRLCRAAHLPMYPITPTAMESIMAALTETHYRSAPGYLSVWKKAHRRKGHGWSDQLAVYQEDLNRAARRGLGPTKKAEAFRAETLPARPNGATAPVTRGGPRFPALLVSIGVLWVLRGGELAAVLGEQASICPDRREACLNLGATKSDPGGKGCYRILRCTCDSGVAGPCPYCSLKYLLELRAAEQLGGKDPLFPTKRGQAAGTRAVIRTIRRVLDCPLATEHSLRRSGAQLYARRGMAVCLIQFLVRWAGGTIFIYVQEALQGQLAAASSAGGTGSLLASDPEPPVTLKALKKEVAKLVKEALDARRAGALDEGHVPPRVVEVAELLHGAGEVHEARRVQGRRGEEGTGKIHCVLICDPCLPQEAWLTRCGWQFGQSDHRLFHEVGPVTCKRCMRSATASEAGAQKWRRTG